MAKSLFSALAALALAVFAPTAANAVVCPGNCGFDFSTGSIVSQTAAGVGNSIIFKSLTDNKLQVKVTAWSIDKGTGSASSANASTANDIVTAATLKLWDGGLGVQNIYEDGSAPNHSIDNGIDGTHNMVDFVMLQFNWNVDVNQMTTGWVGSTNAQTTADSDASVRLSTSAALNNPFNWTTTPALNNKNVMGATSSMELSDFFTMTNATAGMNPAGGATTGTRSIDSGTVNNKPVTSMTWLIGALYGSDSNDYFKLDALNISVMPTVPEPSTWMTMILGFSFIGGTMRRRKSVFGKAVSAA